MSQKQKIKSGDTLSQIAKNRGTTLKALLAANPSIKNANQIRVGQSITIPTKQMSPGDAQRNPFKGTTRTELKAHSDETLGDQAKKVVDKSKGKLKFKDPRYQERANKRSKSATRNAKMRAATERHRS